MERVNREFSENENYALLEVRDLQKGSQAGGLGSRPSMKENQDTQVISDVA